MYVPYVRVHVCADGGAWPAAKVNKSLKALSRGPCAEYCSTLNVYSVKALGNYCLTAAGRSRDILVGIFTQTKVTK